MLIFSSNSIKYSKSVSNVGLTICFSNNSSNSLTDAITGSVFVLLLYVVLIESLSICRCDSTLSSAYNTAFLSV